MPAALNISDQRFGRLVAVESVGSNLTNGRQWLCACDCGASCVVPAGRLRAGKTRSCGCLNDETRGKQCVARNTKHGMREHELYHIWWAMICRCENPLTDGYHRYGGRGISVCDRWRHDFALFVQDMGARPSSKYSIDRIDSNGNYCPENCRWSTMKEQQRNRSTNRLVTYHGETKILIEWSEQLGMSYNVIRDRLHRGWTPDRAFETPVMKQYSHSKVSP